MGVRAPASGWTGLAIGGGAVVVARTLVVGADYLWAPALGERILTAGAVPAGLPFAAAPTGQWPNVGVLGQVLLALVSRLGTIGPGVVQLVADVVTWGLIAAACRARGATDGPTATVLAGVVVGAASAWGVTRLQVLSLVPFALLLLLLQTEHARPSRRVCWIPLLVAVWGNLHGAVLVGVAVAGAYLLGSRLPKRPAESVLVGLATAAALFVNPAGPATIRYYAGVLGNEAARSRTHLWAPLDPRTPTDLVLLVVGLVLLVLAARAAPARWEWLAIGGLLIGTVSAARNGLWLLLVLAPLAAAGASRRPWGRPRAGDPAAAAPAAERRRTPAVIGWAGVACLAAACVGLPTRASALAPVDPGLVAGLRDAVGSRVVLAPEPLSESLAVAGVRVWACDPIDAFDPADQRAYLAFLDGAVGDERAVAGSEVVVVPVGDARAMRLAGQGWSATGAAPAGWVLLSRPRARTAG